MQKRFRLFEERLVERVTGMFLRRGRGTSRVTISFPITVRIATKCSTAWNDWGGQYNMRPTTKHQLFYGSIFDPGQPAFAAGTIRSTVLLRVDARHLHSPQR